MKMIYIAGKYTDARGEWYQHLNIELAKRVARHFWKKGDYAVICPHANSAFMGDSSPSNWEMWLEGDLEMIKRCDMIVMLPNYKDSAGALKELAFAQSYNIDITYVEEYAHNTLAWNDGFTMEIIE